MKFTVYLDFRRKWRWHLTTADGERIATGEPYESREECEAAIDCSRAASSAPLELRLKETPGE